MICQGRLDEVVPLENASMPDRVVVQWDKDDCADMGVVKVDLLGLGMMAVIQDTLTLINEEAWEKSGNSTIGADRESAALNLEPGTGDVLDLAHLPLNDPAVYRMLQEADTVGVFQVESRAQMAILPRLRPERFYDIVVEVAIIRPGPIVGQMVHPYLKRREGKEPVTYPHPSLEPILKRTLGVPLFQEQLLRITMVAAGFSGGEAEELRRAFGFKRSGHRMKQIEVKLRTGMVKKGITGKPADQIVQSITSFALYGFPESHAASFALLVYASAYLKAHYPAAFYTAMLNNQPMGFYHPATLVKDAQRRGVRFAWIDVQFSNWDCTVNEDGTVRLGLRYVTGLREEVGRVIESCSAQELGISDWSLACPKCGSDDLSMLEVISTAAGRRGFCSTCANDWEIKGSGKDEGAGSMDPCHSWPRFRSIDELIARTGSRRDELVTLADIGALNGFGSKYDRRTALWQVDRAVRPGGALFKEIGDKRPRSPLPSMTPHKRIIADYAGTSLTVGSHPMSFKRKELAMRGVMRAIDLPHGKNGRRVRVAGAVITRQWPSAAKGFVFLTLEDETGTANIIVRPDVFTKQRMTILEQQFLLVDGRLQIQDGVTTVKAERCEKVWDAGPKIESHDFY